MSNIRKIVWPILIVQIALIIYVAVSFNVKDTTL